MKEKMKCKQTADEKTVGNTDDARGSLALQNDGSVFCLICCKTLGNIQTGKRHYREVHQTSISMATCSICNATIKKRSIYMHY